MTKVFRFLCLTLLPALATQAAELRIVASDLLAEHLRGPLEAYAESAGGDGISLKSVGSLPAMQRLRSGEADIAVIAVPEGDRVPREGFRVLPFCYAVSIVVVNENNPLDEISVRQLGGIFGSGQELSIGNWGELGLQGWGSRQMQVLVASDPGSIAGELFKHTATGGERLKNTVSEIRNAEAESLVVANPGAIAVLGGLPEKSRLKVLLVGESDGPGFGPSPENVHVGDYPMRLPFYVVTNTGATTELDPVLRELFGDAVSDALSTNRFMPLPEAVRRRLQVDLDLAR